MRFLRKPSKTLLLLHVLPLIIFCVMGGVVAAQAGQDQNWDLQNYHYYDPYAFLHHRQGFDFAVSGIESYNDPLLDTVSYELISHFRPIVASALLGAIQGLNVWIIYELALVVLLPFMKRYWLYGMAFAIAAVSFFGAGNLGETGETMGDNVVSIVVLLSLWLVFRAFQRRQHYSPKKVLLLKLGAYLIAGLALGLKLTSAPYVLGLLVLEFFNWRGWGKCIKQSLLNVASIIIGYLITGGAWAYYLFQTYRSPLFPYYNGIFHSKYADSVNFTDTRWFPHGLMHTIFYPYYFLIHPLEAAEVKFVDPRIALLFTALVGLGILYSIGRVSKRLPQIRIPREVAMLVVFTAIGYVLWEKEFSYYRYLIALEFLSVLTVVAIIWTVIPKQKISIPLSALLLVSLLIITRPMDWGRIPWQPTFFGVELPSNFLVPNSTILLAAGQPLAYMIPSFPRDIPFIRVGASLLSNSTDNAIIRHRINDQRNRGSTFYGIETAASGDVERQYFAGFGYANDTCRTIQSYAGTFLDGGPSYYQICKLKRT